MHKSAFIFSPLELFLKPGQKYEIGIAKSNGIGRKIDKTKPTIKATTREERAANNVNFSDETGITFRSKVVSRSHAEIWVGKDYQVYFKDVGSSSGSFLNRLRLSPSGKDSRPYPLKSEDLIQLGVDYQGRQEGIRLPTIEIYKAVLIKVFIDKQNGNPAKVNRKR